MRDDLYTTEIADFFRQTIFYNHEDGSFKFLVKRSWRNPGDRAGCKKNCGYYYLSAAGRQYAGHHVAWLLYHGEWPRLEIDHIDGDPLNNRILNLRLANRSENCSNKGKNSNNTSGFKGVYWCKQRRKFKAVIGKDYINKVLGFFDSAKDAGEAYAEAAKAMHGEFSSPRSTIR